MIGLATPHFKLTSRVLGALGAVVTVVVVAWLSQALAHPTNGFGIEGDRLRRLAAWTGGDFAEASLQRFGAQMDPATLALAERYAPRPAIDPAQGRSDANDLGPTLQVFRQMSAQDAQSLNAAIPFSKLPNPAARSLVLATLTPDDHARALTCLTMAIYYEAASQSADGQAAVAQVVLNRVRHPLFPKTVCGVVFQGSSLRTGCQFTFTCDGSLARKPSEAGWELAQKIAERALDGYVMKSVGEATHYHTQWVVPYWQPTLVKLTQIGAHIFYRWPGDTGRPVAFSGQYAGYEDAPPQVAAYMPAAAANQALVQASAGGDAAAGPQSAAAPVQVAMVTQPSTVRSDILLLTPTHVTAAPRTSFFGDSMAVQRRLALRSGF